ncbi:glycosyltransferase family 4 protein [Vibrio harveyi]|uniref:glycosyltransferase family 4 protein n=1 Tax=Vibrio harveyi TaxID=669 RepID=UPI00288F8AA1|nr:glycosyltransferase family 4 protein [Vibrio harveyi]
MIVYDGVIEKLQSYGGITVLFEEIIKRATNYEYLSYIDSSKISPSKIKKNYRLLERYRECQVPRLESGKNGIFHSTYYRLPSLSSYKVVTTVHDFTYEKYKSGLSRWVHSYQKRKAVACSDLIICVSQNTKKDLLHYYPEIEEKKVFVVYNGVSEDYFYKSDKEKKQGVIFIGARGGYKNFNAAVLAVKMYGEQPLFIVGGGELSKEEKAFLNKHLGNNYKWFGKLTNLELNDLYNGAYALIYPSLYEGFGIPVIEAMRAGCPVVAVDSSSIPEVSGNAALLVKKPTPDSLSFALANVSKNREEIVKAGLLQSKKFSWEKCSTETFELYEKLLSGHI